VISRDRVRVLVGVLLTLAIVVPLGWMWWNSRLPGLYSVMDMGYADYGGGSRPAGHDMPGMEHMSGGAGVPSLDTPKDRPADVVVDLDVRHGTVKLPSGSFEGYTINGTSPGPTIEATVGQLVEVHVHNRNVTGGIAIHWHGVDVPNAEDGVSGITQNAIKAGKDHTYRWVAPHAGTFWYHSHQVSHEQVAQGLLGAIVIHPEKPEPDVVETVALAHLYESDETVNGRTGDQAVVAKPGQRVRVRAINTDNGAQAIWTSGPFRLLATDGYDVNEPPEVLDRSVVMPAGGRADLEVTVPTDGTAVGVHLGDGRLVIGPEGSTAPKVEQPDKRLDLRDYGSPAPVPFDTAHADRRFTYSIGRKPGFIDGKPGYWWSINGHLYPDMPMMTVREGDIVHVKISNHSGEVHPMHLHGHHAVVLTRDGEPVTGSPWWFDSLDVQNGETFEIAFVADNPGIWMDHCHNLKHAAQGMVTHLMYDGVTTPYKLGSDSGNEPE